MSMFGTRKKRLTALAAGTAVVAIGGGLAYAFWSGGGTGTGTANTGVSSGFPVASTASPDPALTPGGPDQNVAFTVTNAGTGSQDLNSVVVTVANPTGTEWVAAPGCSAADYTVDAPDVAYGQLAGGAVANGTVAIRMINSDANQDACQGVNPPLYFVAS